MPAFVRGKLNMSGLMRAYGERPPCRQNDYVAWIARAKREEAKARRLDQMPLELARGDRSMKMPCGGGRQTLRGRCV